MYLDNMDYGYKYGLKLMLDPIVHNLSFVGCDEGWISNLGTLKGGAIA